MKLSIETQGVFKWYLGRQATPAPKGASIILASNCQGLSNLSIKQIKFAYAGVNKIASNEYL